DKLIQTLVGQGFTAFVVHNPVQSVCNKTSVNAEFAQAFAVAVAQAQFAGTLIVAMIQQPASVRVLQREPESAFYFCDCSLLLLTLPALAAQLQQPKGFLSRYVVIDGSVVQLIDELLFHYDLQGTVQQSARVPRQAIAAAFRFRSVVIFVLIFVAAIIFQRTGIGEYRSLPLGVKTQQRIGGRQ